MTGRHGFLLSKGAFTTIDPPGAVFTNPLGINSGGEIVGRFCTTLPCASDRENVHGFLLSDGEFTTIDIPGARGTNAWKINPRGDIVGGYTGADGKKHVFLLSLRKRDFITIDVPGTAEASLDNGGINLPTNAARSERLTGKRCSCPWVASRTYCLGDGDC